MSLFFITFLLFVGISVLQGVSGIDYYQSEKTQNCENKIISLLDIDWWPMFHHDSQNAGY